MPSLFELVNQSETVAEELLGQKIDELVAAGIPWEEACNRAVAAMDALTADKVLAYGGIIRRKEAEADAIREAMKRNLSRALAAEHLAERLRRRLVELLPRDYKASNEHLAVAIKKCPPKLDGIARIGEWPDDLKVEVPATWQPNREAIKAVIKGKDPDNAEDVALVAAALPGLQLVRDYRVDIK